MDFTLLIIIVILAFSFDMINGFHDAANSIATIVSTKVLTPFQAVVWAASFNWLAYLVFNLQIADTIAKTVDTSAITLMVITIRNPCCNYLESPYLVSWNTVKFISYSRGGFSGAAIAYAGWGVVHTGIILKIAAFIFLAPLIGMLFSYLISIILLWFFRRANPFRLEKKLKIGQLFSSALFSLGHGGNDAQKVMGIIAAALLVFYNGVDASAIPHWAQIDMVNGKIHDIPHWIVLGCYTAIGLGTLIGGWRIVKTMGTKITKITPFEGVAAETAGALLLFGTEAFGIPVSTTHTITGAIMGVGMTKRVTAVRWGVTINLLYAWILTIPVSMGIAAGMYVLLSAITGLK